MLRMMRSVFFGGGFALLVSTAQAQMAAHLPLPNIDVLQYKIEAWVHDLKDRPVDFDTELRVRILNPTSEVSLNVDLSRMSIADVQAWSLVSREGRLEEGKALEIKWRAVAGSMSPGSRASSDLIKMSFRQQLQQDQRILVKVIYEVAQVQDRAREGLFTQKNFGGAPILVSRGWPYYTRMYLPTNDHPSDVASFQSILHVPADLTAVANGASGKSFERVELDRSGKRVFRYYLADQIPTYGYQLSVGALTRETRELCWTPSTAINTKRIRPCRRNEKGIVLSIFYRPGSHLVNELLSSARQSDESLAFFQDHFGPYKFGDLSVLIVPHPFNMETVGQIVLMSPEAITHEVIHQWFGNSVRIAHWGDLWISEGFTVYLTGLYNEIATGTNDACKQEDGRLNHPSYTDVRDIFDSRPYCKGSSSIDDLRTRLSRHLGILKNSTESQRLILGFIRNIYARFQGRTMSTEELVAELHRSSYKWIRELQLDPDNKTSPEKVAELITKWSQTWFHGF